MAYNRNYKPRPAGSSFHDSVSAWVAGTKVRCDRVVRAVVTVGLKTAIDTTPVDTGRAQASWRLSREVIDHSVDTRPPRIGTSTKDFGTAVANGNRVLFDQIRRLRGVVIGHVWWVTNDLHYIIPLEDGYSTKGRAMLQKAFGACVTAFPGIVARAKGMTGRIR